MKTFKVLSLLLFALFTFNACGNDDKENIQEENPLQKEYFSIDQASYVDKKLEGGTEDVIEDIQINKTVITGGSVALYITSAKELSSVKVGLDGVNGHYDYALPKAVTQRSAKAGVYEYEVIILLSQALASNNLVFNLVAVAADGLLGKLFKTEDIKVIEAGMGDLQISLSWDQLDDVDLHLYDITMNKHIYFADRYITAEGGAHKDASRYVFLRLKLLEETDQPVEDLDPFNSTDQYSLLSFAIKAGIDIQGAEFNLEYNQYLAKNATDFGIIGMLDIDSNADCRIDKINNENIAYFGPKDGVYTIQVNLYSKCSNAPYPKYNVTINYKGKRVVLSDLHRGQFSSSGSSWVTIGSFTLNKGELTVGGDEEEQAFDATHAVKTVEVSLPNIR